MSRDDLEPVWKALADPTRRAVLDLLRAGPRPTGEVCGEFPRLSRFAVMKHLAVLKAASLVLVRSEGRIRMNHLNVVPIQRLYERWVRGYESHFARGLLAIERAVLADVAPSAAPDATPPVKADPKIPAREGRSRARSPGTHVRSFPPTPPYPAKKQEPS